MTNRSIRCGAAAIAIAGALATTAASANPFFLFAPLGQPQLQTRPGPAEAIVPREEEPAEQPARFKRQIVDYRTTRTAGHGHHRYAQHLSLFRARQRQGGPLRHRRRPRRLHLVRRRRRSRARPSGRTGCRRPRCSHRQPYLPRFMAGGPGNPLGARAMYLGGTIYRIHGTNAPSTRSAARFLAAASAWSTRT